MEDDDRQRALLAWYDGAGRELPWRDSSDPYAVLVSEFMLQQTQAARVTDRFTAFLHRFPSVDALAAAGAGAVILEWHGLGYNRRALALHRTAERIVAEHGGRVPCDPAVLQTLPGVGPYTARAVAAFAYGHRAAPVDVNVARVLSRAVAGRPLDRRTAQPAADDQIQPPRPAAARPGDWSQALMDLGVAHCRPRSPVCASCPIRTTCAWRRHACAGTDDPAGGAMARAGPPRPFAGSDRQFRGRLLAAVRRGPVALACVPEAMGLRDDPQRALRLTRRLIGEGLLRYGPDDVRLP